ncbi:MAG TPA: SCO4226 family nickel-binding protein [Chloroflexota bacterium]|nr:SCO4226 family nickel-binding protein [Chloroflexota bacterium]
MAQFMDVHRGMVGVTEEQLLQAHRQDQAIEQEEGVRFIKAWADPRMGMVFCLSEGPNKDAVLRVHARAGHPTEEIYEVPLTIE